MKCVATIACLTIPTLQVLAIAPDMEMRDSVRLEAVGKDPLGTVLSARSPEDQAGFVDIAPLRLELASAGDWRVSPGMVQDETPLSIADEGSMMPVQRAPHFGEEGSWRLNFGGTFAYADGGRFFGAGVSASYFFIENLSIDFGLNLLWFDQNGPDTWGAGLTVLFRWHFYAQPTWSLYIDGGAGFLKTSDDVPSSGTNYNFTPQAGGGVSFDIGNDWRLMVGARWHHISNANLSSDNPGRDSGQGYIMFSMPF